MLEKKIGHRNIRGLLARYGSLVLLTLLLGLLLLGSGIVRADSAAFDLAGPPIDMRVTRGTKTLPISRTANLQPGDRLWIHPDLPESQSVRICWWCVFARVHESAAENLVHARGNLDKQVREEGISVTVPQTRSRRCFFWRRRRAATSARCATRCAAGRALLCGRRRI